MFTIMISDTPYDIRGFTVITSSGDTQDSKGYIVTGTHCDPTADTHHVNTHCTARTYRKRTHT